MTVTDINRHQRGEIWVQLASNIQIDIYEESVFVNASFLPQALLPTVVLI